MCGELEVWMRHKERQDAGCTGNGYDRKTIVQNTNTWNATRSRNKIEHVGAPIDPIHADAIAPP